MAAYIKDILRNTIDSHQTSPSYVLTIIRWNNRDTVNYSEPSNLTRSNFVVISDAIDIQTGKSKKNVTGSLSVVLKAGDINYATAFAPGDYIMVNLLTDERKAIEVYNRASDGLSINRYSDGFKGLYKIQKIRRQIITNPETGHKTYQFVLHAFSFSELNSVIYFNPTGAAAFRENKLLFLTRFSSWWGGQATTAGKDSNVQDILIKITKGLMGAGLNKSDFIIPESQNAAFITPPSLARLLSKGRKSKTITDIYNFVFGVWKANNVNTTGGIIKEKDGFNPSIKKFKNDNSFFVTAGGLASQLKGYRQVGVEDFNQKRIWSILQSYSNSAINEGYTATRVGLDGNVYPTIVFRQKPFSSNHFQKPFKINNKKNKKNIDFSHTKFSEIPRWRITPDLIYSVDLGKDDIGRINYVQLYGRSVAINEEINKAFQASNIFFDQEDISRHGMRPAVVTSNFDHPQSSDLNELQSKKWSYLLFDMLNAGHLRESGTIICYGIEDPIAVGDNLEFDGAIYHIESLAHKMSINPQTGKKLFRTILTLSFGTSVDSTKTKPVYPQMEFTDSLTERQRGPKNKRILPGFSDTQHLPRAESKGTRADGEEIEKTNEVTFTRDVVNKNPRNRPSTIGYSNDEYQPVRGDKKKKTED